MKRPQPSVIAILALLFFNFLDDVRAQTLRGTTDQTYPKSYERRLDGEAERYIVVFKDQPAVGTDATLDPQIAPIKQQIQTSVADLNGIVTHSYTHALNAFAAILPPEAFNALNANPNIAYIQKDSVVTISTTQTTDLPWSLDRIDQEIGTDGSYTYSVTGAGVHAYVIDTGIRSTHAEFTGRLGEGYNALTGNVASPQPWDDCDGHGTHVASTIGGTKYGVAKGVTLHAVRVMNCEGKGNTSDIIDGIDWVVSQHSQNVSQKFVVNMSMETRQMDRAWNEAAEKMVAAGILVAVAAGNNGGDACKGSPASARNALTVAATTALDIRAFYSNYGPCVDIFAPGDSILGAGFNCDTCKVTKFGTSMASPHVAGVAALYLETNDETPAQVRNALLSSAVYGIVSGARTPSNYFLQTNVVPFSGNCHFAGESCRKFRCSKSSSCCCSGLKCKGFLKFRCG